MIVIAHRGASQEFFENSWPAFERAVELGCDRIETDLWLSKDKEIFIAHDNDLSRLTGQKRLIAELSTEELKALRLKNDTPLPILRELLKRFGPRIELNLELKGTDTALAKVAAKMVADSHCSAQIIFSSFYIPHLAYLRESGCPVRTALLWGEDTAEADGARPSDPIAVMDRLNIDTLHPEVALVDAELMARTVTKKYLVFPWISARDELAEQCENIWDTIYGLGVHGHCTNHPREMLRWRKMRNIGGASAGAI